MARIYSLPVSSVLIPEAHALGMLAAIRSLGRAGYQVHAASPQDDAIGFASRYCTARAVCPELGSTSYVGWLRGYIASHGIDAIIPGGAFLLAIESWFEEFQPLLPIASDRAIVYRALSKTQVYEAFQTAPAELMLLDHHPPSLIIARGDPQPSADDLASLGEIHYLKADARHSRTGMSDLLMGPLLLPDTSAAAQQALLEYGRIIIQGAVAGRQAGVTLLMDENGNVLAENCFRDVHDAPTRRGTMSLRHTWAHPELIADAARRLRYLRWQGAAMLEYRVRDSDNTFDFIELNPRFWQSMHLDLLAGIDFPKLQLAWFQRQGISRQSKARDVTCGDMWPGEITRMLEIWRSSRFTNAQRTREALGFIGRLCDWRIASDYDFPGDRLLYWRRVLQILRRWLRPRR